jgi:integrase
VARRRFQDGSVFKNKAGTVWLGQYSEYVLDSNGVEKRKRKQVMLGPIHKANGETMTMREARRLLQPYVDRVNSSIASPNRQYNNATFEAFSKIWERDYLCLSKPSTQCTMRGHVKRLVAAFGDKDIRRIDAGDLQRVIAKMEKDGLEPKTIRNLWATVRLIWDAALAQKYVDATIPKPKLPRNSKKKPRCFSLEDAARIIAHSQDSLRVFYWLAAETGLRAGELCALSLSDVELDRLTVVHSVWHGRIGSPKTDNARRTIALSPELAELIWEQVYRQKKAGHNLLFSTGSGRPWDAGLVLKRKLHPLLDSLGISRGAFHAFRHFNASLLSSLRIPLKVIQDRLGHSSVGVLALDVYMHPAWEENMEAAMLAGERIQKTVNSVSLTAVKEKGPPTQKSEALEAA